MLHVCYFWLRILVVMNNNEVCSKMVLVDVTEVMKTRMHGEMGCVQFLHRSDCAVPLPVEFDASEVNTFRVCCTLIGYSCPTKQVFLEFVTNKSSIFLVFRMSFPSRSYKCQ